MRMAIQTITLRTLDMDPHAGCVQSLSLLRDWTGIHLFKKLGKAHRELHKIFLPSMSVIERAMKQMALRV